MPHALAGLGEHGLRYACIVLHRLAVRDDDACLALVDEVRVEETDIRQRDAYGVRLDGVTLRGEACEVYADRHAAGVRAFQMVLDETKPTLLYSVYLCRQHHRRQFPLPYGAYAVDDGRGHLGTLVGG